MQVHEPDEEKALLMLRSTVNTLEKHHRVLLLDEAVSAAVKLSHRYIPARQLPDKAVALLDTACARVAVSRARSRRSWRIACTASPRWKSSAKSLNAK